MKIKALAGAAVRRLRSRASRTDQRGASLVEIIIATFILGLVAVGMVEFFARGNVGFDQEERKRVAVLLAQEALERTVALDYADMDSWSATRTVDGTAFGVVLTVTEDSPELDMKTLDCVVSWGVAGGATRQTQVATLVFEN
ncbi:MAG TPA: prepilin-type N-terminal cleavage/methylation domain-containing protein [Candidatus Krumholzibacteria bacterium]|nr:prepilin-type N-terminal cleavage/methylation domain-containing protein [Candidatus Krumholzibacteria bacterium]HRX50623.1 prepilin-type N-terminal cleavage/methylation domain-containing protein [Candidatus Krumholzibacteria bacterium]